MDIDHAVAPGGDEARRQQPHEAGEADELGARRLERAVEGAVELGARGVVAMRHDRGADAGGRGAGEAGRRGLIRQHQHDLGRRIGRAAGLDQRLHVAAAAGDQDGGLQARQALSMASMTEPGAPAARSWMRPTR
jgi:hypothetical protein